MLSDEYTPHSYNMVIQTTPNKEERSKTVEESWQRYFKGTRIVMDDNECKHFLLNVYGSAYVNQFDYLKKGAHKADLFRYAWLYKYGGVYCDIKTVLIRPFEEVFSDDRVCYFVNTMYKWHSYRRIYNGVIATPPNNPLIYEMLQGAMRHSNQSGYLAICEHGFEVITSAMGLKHIPKGRTYVDDSSIPDVHMYTEEHRNSNCKGQFDQYGLCNYINDEHGKHMIFVRDTSYNNTSPSQMKNSRKRHMKRKMETIWFEYIFGILDLFKKLLN